MDNKEIAQLGATDATRAIVVGNDVYDPLTFQPDIVRFSRKQYVFLNAYRLGVPLSEAAAKAGISQEAAERFLDKADTVKWLQDRALQQHIKTEWEEPAKWWNMGNQVLEGHRQFNKTQSEVWKEFGRRIAPVSPESQGGTKIEITIDGEALQRSKERRKSIEAQIVKDDHAA